ncbi:P-loop containing nucleoside triphosphate hydrolase protein [Mycena capillaripes]|nr:P-loop containing nucleoside triphosphate hydrolase protein [Mycena capillaripes]
MAPPRINVGWNEPYYDAIQTYSKRFLAMLEAEQQEDEAVLKERLSTWSLTRLQEEGYCLTGLSAFWLEENQFGRPVASFLLGPGLTLPLDHRFENSTQVLLSRIDPLRESLAQGSVVSRSAFQIRIAFHEHFDDLDTGSWRIDVGRSNIVYTRMRDAIGNLNHDPQQLEAAAMSADRELILQGTHLRDILLRSSQPVAEEEVTEEDALQPDSAAFVADEGLAQEESTVPDTHGAFKDDQRIHSWAQRYSQPKPLVMEGDPPLDGLNATQIRAMAMMVGQRLSLIQGPPGTGKTKTIIETVKLLKVHFEVPHPLLVCTYTNVAVDNLVEGLAASGVKPLRVGFGGQVKDSLVEHTLDYKLDHHRLEPSLAALVKEEEAISQRIHDISEKLEKEKLKSNPTPAAQERTRQIIANVEADLALRQRMQGALKSRIYALKMEMLHDVVTKADVICTTCITSASAALNVVDFPVVFLDEASMSTEPASLIPIMKGSRHLALIGDHKQLPPVITSAEAQALGLGRSLFERLTEEGVVPSIMLDTQYRMHPGISLFPSGEFYNFSLQDGTVDEGGNVSPRLTPPTSVHLKEDKSGKRPAVIFLDHTGGESLKDKSRVNQNEAAIVAGVVEDLLLNNPTLMGKDIGIIAPYVAQISLLTRLFNTNAKYRARFEQVLGEHRALQLAHIEIKTVDGFEGREKEIIVFSTVRNNAGGYIGFLADRRRLNVGLTRAKRGLFVVGSISTLGKGMRVEPKAKAKAAEVKKGQSLVVQPGDITVIEAKEAKILRPGSARAKGKNKGQDSWKRYAQWLTDCGLVIRLGGDSLGQALYGNLQRASKANKTKTVLKE